jgi:hypothetical protein
MYLTGPVTMLDCEQQDEEANFGFRLLWVDRQHRGTSETLADQGRTLAAGCFVPGTAAGAAVSDGSVSTVR